MSISMFLMMTISSLIFIAFCVWGLKHEKRKWLRGVFWALLAMNVGVLIVGLEFARVLL